MSKATTRSFDGISKDVVDEIELEVSIGPITFSIPFQVLDIPSTFTMLLGRPWIHVSGVVPSTLYQKVKFAVNGRLITVHDETGHRANLRGMVPYIEPQTEEKLSYHTFELVSIMHIPQGIGKTIPTLPKPTNMAGKVLLTNGFIPGTRLGKHG